MSKHVTMATWDDVPHLSEQDKADQLASYPPYQRDARSKGIPMLGSGAIYPVQEDEFLCKPFDIPAHWPRAYGFDVGWKNTAAVFMARDLDNDIVYLTSEYKRGDVEPASHAAAIRGRGEWLQGAVDPASRGRGQADGLTLMQRYTDLGLHLHKADNGVESGLFAVFQRLSTGRLRVFKTCEKWLEEFRLYRRDEKGGVVKENDHLMDATRYLIVTGIHIATVNPALFEKRQTNDGDYDPIERGFLNRRSETDEYDPFKLR